MKWRHAVYALSCLLVLTAVAKSQDNSERFDPVSLLAGSCWEGAFPNGATDLHCWEWALGGAYLRDRHKVRGAGSPYAGETLYGWDSDSSALHYWYFNSLGGRSEGGIQKIDGEERWLITESYAGATPGQDEPSKIEMRNFMTVEDDAYTMITEQRDGASWKEVMSIRFERTDQTL